ncbi:hypothetical protein PR048_032715 [Dryococelus australis]|uniref:Tc1-like transposase DDE domain-containing protein n=1 Tax=Dryococelus australis TaxID=614101 RepID=A0ABQ9G2Z6_9NEOP|nr:hypothetical protein PR048_032715 [Dryococelus australis]
MRRDASTQPAGRNIADGIKKRNVGNWEKHKIRRTHFPGRDETQSSLRDSPVRPAKHVCGNRVPAKVREDGCSDPLPFLRKTGLSHSASDSPTARRRRSDLHPAEGRRKTSGTTRTPFKKASACYEWRGATDGTAGAAVLRCRLAGGEGKSYAWLPTPPHGPLPLRRLPPTPALPFLYTRPAHRLVVCGGQQIVEGRAATVTEEGKRFVWWGVSVVGRRWRGSTVPPLSARYQLSGGAGCGESATGPTQGSSSGGTRKKRDRGEPVGLRRMGQGRFILKAVHDKVSTFEMNLRKMSLLLRGIYFNLLAEGHAHSKVVNDGWKVVPYLNVVDVRHHIITYAASRACILCNLQCARDRSSFILQASYTATLNTKHNYLIKAALDEMSTLEMNLRKKTPPPAYVLTGEPSDMRPVNTSVDMCFMAFGVGPLVFVRGSMNTEAYCNTLCNEMLPTLWRFYGMDPCYFQDDNARCHVSRATMQWYADSNVRRLDWPAQSPDLNPIEYLWDELDLRVRARQARSKSAVQLMEWLQEEWRRIPVYVLQTLVESMKDRVAAVIAARVTRALDPAVYLTRPELNESEMRNYVCREPCLTPCVVKTGYSTWAAMSEQMSDAWSHGSISRIDPEGELAANAILALLRCFIAQPVRSFFQLSCSPAKGNKRLPILDNGVRSALIELLTGSLRLLLIVLNSGWHGTLMRINMVTILYLSTNLFLSKLIVSGNHLEPWMWASGHIVFIHHLGHGTLMRINMVTILYLSTNLFLSKLIVSGNHLESWMWTSGDIVFIHHLGHSIWTWTSGLVTTLYPTANLFLSKLIVSGNHLGSGAVNIGGGERGFVSGKELRVRLPNRSIAFSRDDIVCVYEGQAEDLVKNATVWGLNYVPVSLLASHQGDPGLIPGRVTPDFRMRESCRTTPLVGGFSQAPPVSSTLSFRRCPILTSITLIGSQDLDGLVLNLVSDFSAIKLPGNRLKSRKKTQHDGNTACQFSGLPTRLYSLVCKYADINCTLVVCCRSGRRRLDTVLQEPNVNYCQRSKQLHQQTQQHIRAGHFQSSGTSEILIASAIHNACGLLSKVTFGRVQVPSAAGEVTVAGGRLRRHGKDKLQAIHGKDYCYLYYCQCGKWGRSGLMDSTIYIKWGCSDPVDRYISNGAAEARDYCFLFYCQCGKWGRSGLMDSTIYIKWGCSDPVDRCISNGAAEA